MKEFFKKILKGFLTPKQYKQLKKLYAHILCCINSRDLRKLALICGTDKWNAHWYAQHYQKHFKDLRKRRLSILEIGTGGYDDPAKGGASLKMWKYYFPNSMIFSIDIYDKSFLQDKRTKIFKGSQNDKNFLEDVFNKIGSLDIIIDDGSHINEHVITAFKTLFPLLNDDGIYIVEDTQTSYWEQFGGDSENLNNPATTMNFFKTLADHLNYAEFMKPEYIPTYFDRNIIAIHFYHNLVFIYKGTNEEKNIHRPHAACG